MDKFEIIVSGCVLLISAWVFSEWFAGRKKANIKGYIGLAAVLTFFTAITFAILAECDYTGEFNVLYFLLNIFSVISITIGVAAVFAMIKIHRDDNKWYRDMKKRSRMTKKFIKQKRAELRTSYDLDSNDFTDGGDFIEKF